MQTFTRYTLLVLAQICAIAALLAAYEAHQYMTIGRGLNPLAAMPAATLLLLLPYCFIRYIDDFYGDDA